MNNSEISEGVRYLTSNFSSVIYTTDISNASPHTIASGNYLTVKFSVPIAGWVANPKPLLAFPTITYGQDVGFYEANTHAGYGSTNTRIPYYTNVTKNTVSNYGTITNDSTNGWSFTATRRCKVTLDTLVRLTSVGDQWGISLNGTTLSTNIYNNEYTEQLAYDSLSSAYQQISPSAAYVLDPSDVIRVHGSAAAVSDNISNIRLTVEPEEGQVNQAAIISQPVAYCRMKNLDGIVTLGSNTTVTLSQIDGDIAAVGLSLSSNDFTLPAGKYEIDWAFNIWCNGLGEALGACQLYNVTDALVVQNGSAAAGDGTNYGTIANSIGSTLVTITKSTTFRIRGSNIRNSGSHTLYAGYSSLTTLAADPGMVKITRKK